MSSVRAVVACATVLAAAVPAWSQITTGRLIGTVVDGAGAPLSGVSVTIASPALIGGPQTGVTNAGGEYSFVGIAPGDYAVRAELSGFLTQERDRVKPTSSGADGVLTSITRRPARPSAT